MTLLRGASRNLKKFKTAYSIKEPNPAALKALFPASSCVFLLAIRKYCCVEETPDYAKTKAFLVLRSFKMPCFCGVRKKVSQCGGIARLFDAVTAKKGVLKPYRVRPSYV